MGEIHPEIKRYVHEKYSTFPPRITDTLRQLQNDAQFTILYCDGGVVLAGEIDAVGDDQIILRGPHDDFVGVPLSRLIWFRVCNPELQAALERDEKARQEEEARQKMREEAQLVPVQISDVPRVPLQHIEKDSSDLLSEAEVLKNLAAHVDGNATSSE